MSFLRKLINFCRVWSSSRANVSIGANTTVGRGVVTKPGAGRITVGRDCALETGVVLETYGGEITLQAGVFLGPYVVIYGHGGVTVGEKSLIGMHSRIVSSNHTFTHFDQDIRLQPDVLSPTHIGRDVWLGAGVTVLGGVRIGDGCVVGAGAVVTNDLPAGAIAAGVPAKIVKYRRGSPAVGNVT